MQKDKVYTSCRFSADILNEAIAVADLVAKRHNDELEPRELYVEVDDATWHHDTAAEFLADYRKLEARKWAVCRYYGAKTFLCISVRGRDTHIEVKAPERAGIAEIYAVFEKHLGASTLEPPAKQERLSPVIFIGHGRSAVWRDLKDHLQDKHGFSVEAYETGARAGHTIRDILEEMVSNSSFALLVLTGEDEQADGTMRARQNVVHEVGLFQGRLGFSRAIMLLEEGVELFSNVQGIHYLKFSRGNVKEVFGEVVATLHREFRSNEWKKQ